MSIALNEKELRGSHFDTIWAFPPDCPPQQVQRFIRTKESKGRIDVVITGGLVRDKDPAGSSYGAYFYCNNRLIASAVRDEEVGYVSGKAGVPHHRASLARVIVCVNGASARMPWNSNKTGINYSHDVFVAIKDDIVRLMSTYSGLSRRMKEDYETQVAPFSTGQVDVLRLDADEPLKPSRLPPIPKARKGFKDEVLELNAALGAEKPWVRGLYEAIIAEEVISRQRGLEYRNRISLIVLDSTAEIAMKEYLLNASATPPTKKELEKLTRAEVHARVQSELLQVAKTFWQKMDYYYKARCLLIHEKAGATIADSDLADYRASVRLLLTSAFGVQFPT